MDRDLLRAGDWFAGRTLEELQMDEEGVLVLGIARKDGSYAGAPHSAARVEAGDTVLLYGRSPSLAGLSERQPGPEDEAARQGARRKQQERAREEAAAGGGPQSIHSGSATTP